ncbi:MAG TPA: DUF2088 domain-containing protein [Blastocatellia bacterium]|nr:DUF2088 domain-containing protein [Blastocatellia bacterium]
MVPVKLIKIRQTFNRDSIIDIERVVREQLTAARWTPPSGGQVALAVGSRGIANLARMVKAVADYVRENGGQPFITPAMGSHGGATAEGQLRVLASYGVTEQHIGCAIRSSMETVELPADGLEHRLYMDRHAYHSNGVILINRIKPHTDYHGTYESGLVKMSVIGLGKERQASEIHRFGVYGLKELIPRAAERILSSGKIVLGIGVVENAYEETAVIEAMAPERIMSREPELLDQARRLMPGLPIDRLDVLIVDRMGKDISGVGLDTNIIGRLKISGQPEPETPAIRMIVVTDLTDQSHGNATGIGLADITTRRLMEKIDFAATCKNVVTSSFLERGKLPVAAETDREALEFALRACGPIPQGREKIIRIKDTLHLDELYVSQAALDEIRGRERIEIIGGFEELFDEHGSLT